MALLSNSVVEYWSTGSNDNAGMFTWTTLVNSTYKWTASGSGTNEYYVELAAGGDPSLSQPGSVYLDGNFNLASEGTVGSLAVSEWDYADNDTLGYSTVYVRLADGADPDTKRWYYVGMSEGTDYTQQAAAQLTLTDLATDGAGTGLSSSTGGFTAAMIDNHIFIKSGTGFTVGRYRITAYTDTNNVTIDRSAGASASAGTGSVGGALAVPIDAHFDNANYFPTGGGAGGTMNPFVYFKAGTYTFTESCIITTGGLSTNFKQIFGYQTTRGDDPTGDNRPLFTMGAYQWYFASYWRMYNVRATSTASYVFQLGNYSQFINCKATNLSTSTTDHGFNLAGTYGKAINCEADLSTVGGNSHCFNITGNGTEAIYCYAHDSDAGGTSTGFYLNSLYSRIAFCIADTCTYGVQLRSSGQSLVNCILYNNTTGLSGASGGIAFAVINNDFNSNTTGISHTWSDNQIVLNTNFYNNTADYAATQRWKDTTATADDPEYTDAANGDFSNTLSANGYPSQVGATDTNLTQGISQSTGGAAETAYGYVS
jgi:hypothetical protein